MKITVEMTDEEFIEYKKYKDDKEYFVNSLKNRFGLFVRSLYQTGNLSREKYGVIEDVFDTFVRRHYENTDSK